MTLIFTSARLTHLLKEDSESLESLWLPGARDQLELRGDERRGIGVLTAPTCTG